MKQMKQHLSEVLLNLQWGFVFMFCTVFGVAANEALVRIKTNSSARMSNIHAKVILALFVCYLAHNIYEYYGYDKRFENAFIALCAFLHYPIASYLRKEFVPMLVKIALGALNGKDKNG